VTKSRQMQAVMNVFAAIRKLSKEKDVRSLQAHYGANREKIIRIHISDFGPSFYLQAIQGKMKVMMRASKYDIHAKLSSTTLLNVVRKKRKVYSYKDKRDVFKVYSMFQAYQFGHIQAEGDMANNDLRLIFEIFDDHVDDINDIVEGRRSIHDLPGSKSKNPKKVKPTPPDASDREGVRPPPHEYDHSEEEE